MTKTRADIIASISKGTGIPVKEVRTVIEAFLEEIKEVYYTNDRIEFRGFGVFGNKFRKGRIGRNPRTNEGSNPFGCRIKHGQRDRQIPERSFNP